MDMTTKKYVFRNHFIGNENIVYASSLAEADSKNGDFDYSSVHVFKIKPEEVNSMALDAIKDIFIEGERMHEEENYTDAQASTWALCEIRKQLRKTGREV
jgi:hypothetical protein